MTKIFKHIYDCNGSALGCVYWIGDQRSELIVDGKKWLIPSIHCANGEPTEKIEGGLQELLFGMTPEELGLELLPDMDFEDHHADQTPGYSFLTDPRNSFLKVEQSLGAAVLGSEKGQQLHPLHEKVTENMALSWHLSGGQPARAAEFATIKQGSITQSDKAVAHCIPWVLARQFLIMNTLIWPFVGQLIRHMFGEERQPVQENTLFAAWGKRMESEMLSDQLQKFFPDRLGIDNVEVNTHHMVARVIAAVDAQAEHTSETAAMQYTLDAAEQRAFLSTTINKFILVSILWWPYSVASQYLTDKEIHGVRTAPTKLSGENPQLDTEVLATRLEEQLTHNLLPKVQDQIIHSHTVLTAELREALDQDF
ncbi:hypothetical protein FRC07_002225 [Ceratobasidium sp. 392]|nr:hypothetical protein FRC07_002225 [Ceratobasidium sp. 392]